MSTAGEFRTSVDIAESNSTHGEKNVRETETERAAETLISIEEIVLEEEATTKPKVKRLRKGKLQDEDGKRGGYRKYSYEQLEQAMEALRSRRMSLCDAEKRFNVPKATLFGRLRRSHAERTSCTSVLSKDEFSALDDVRSAILAANEAEEDILKVAFRARNGRDVYDSEPASDLEDKHITEKVDDDWIRLELRSVIRCERDARREREAHVNAFATLVHAGFDELVSLARGRVAIRCSSLDEIEMILNAYQRRSPFRFIRSRVDKHAAQFGALPAPTELLAKNAIQFRSRSGAQNVIEFDGVPFVKVAERRFVCEHSRRPESKQLKSDEPLCDQPVSECDVNVCILQLVRFPQYRVLTDTNRGRLFCSSLLLRDFVDQRANVVLDCHYLVYLPSIVEHCYVHHYDLTSATFILNEPQLLTVRDEPIEAESDVAETAADLPRPAEVDLDDDTLDLAAISRHVRKVEPSSPETVRARTGLHRRFLSTSAAAHASRKRAARLGRPAFDFKFPSLVVTSRPGRKVTRRRSTPANCRVVPCVFELIRTCVLDQDVRDTTFIQAQIRDWWLTHCGVVPVESDWSRRPPLAVVQHQIDRVLRGCTAPMSDVEEPEPQAEVAPEGEVVDVDVDADVDGIPLGDGLKPDVSAASDGQVVYADENVKPTDATYEYSFEAEADVEAGYALIEPATQPKAKRGRSPGVSVAVTPRGFGAATRRRGGVQHRTSTQRKRGAQNGIEMDDAVRTISLDQPDVTIVDLDDVAEWVQLT